MFDRITKGSTTSFIEHLTKVPEIEAGWKVWNEAAGAGSVGLGQRKDARDDGGDAEGDEKEHTPPLNCREFSEFSLPRKTLATDHEGPGMTCG